ncbi:MAG TPA: ribose 5-phosphate isomerase B [Bacteroidales bacterium]|nr:ribose 5-phosphate isomerase B [Bacteroidales bacterium]
MKIVIGSDHAGFYLKQFIIEHFTKLFTFEDVGTFSSESVDYPDFAHPLAKLVSEGKFGKAILICGSGNGVAMTANKHPHVRAALCWSEEIAQLARLHNDANVLVLPARFITKDHAIKIIDVFFNTPFEGGRHQNRVNKVNL